MKVIWNENPLLTHYELDERDIEYMRSRLMNELILDEISNVDVNASREDIIAKVNYIQSSEMVRDVATEVTRLMTFYLDALSPNYPHCGDCTKVACGCVKCHAEEALNHFSMGTTLSHYNHIVTAFKDGRTLDEAINFMENNPPTATWDGWEQYAPRWRKSQLEELDWLKGYKETHFPS